MPLDGAPTPDPTFPLTRAQALARLAEFVPSAGSAFARLRNLDRGPGSHQHVSRLSPALRRRLLSEEEVVGAVLAIMARLPLTNSSARCSRRTYWKGWLEQRPAVWSSFLDAVTRAETKLAGDAAMTDRHRRAITGQTGIDRFDAWATELVETGYLHNWARMQFASIWIFSLRLPWELGAAFMFGHLLDADPASNTLSWRWVAGLHTIGKTYLANAERIRAMTDGRFDPKGLAVRAHPIVDSIFVPNLSPLQSRNYPDPAKPSALLLTVEDLSLETIPALGQINFKAIAILDATHPADRIALEDGLQRCRNTWPQADFVGSLTPETLNKMASLGVRQMVTGHAPVGPVATRISGLQSLAETAGIRIAEHLRGWDRRAWPHCTKGFFGLKEKMPMLIDRMENAA